MTPRLLPEPLTAYRIGDPAGQYPVWSVEGSRRVSGRWHEAGAEVIYAAEHYSTAMLEKLVHWNGALPPNQHFVTVTVPAGTSYEVVTQDILPGWHSRDGEVARRYARDWYASLRAALLIVPSVVARMERNFVLNTRHADVARIHVGLETPVWWDRRLFG